MEAKRLAVGEFFGEFISSYTKVEMFTLAEDRIVASSAGFVRIKGSPVFESGDSFGEVCVIIDAYVTQEDLDKFKPISITKKHCVSDPNLTASQIKKHAKEQAIITALIDYDRKLEARNKEDILPLIHNLKYLESGFIPGTESYCIKFQGVIYPIEIFALGVKPIRKFDKTLKEEITEKAVNKPVKEKVSGVGRIFYEQDFSDVNEGNIPNKWIGGESLIVSSDGRQKYITPFEGQNHSFSVVDVDFPEDFKLEWILQTPPPGWWGHTAIIGDVKIKIYNNGRSVLMNNTAKNIDNIAGKTIKISLEKYSGVFKLFIDGRQIMITRYPRYRSPKGFSFEFNFLQFKLYKIIGISL